MPTGHGLRAPNSLCCGPCFPGPHRQPVLPNPPPVVLLGPASIRCLLLYAAGVSLDQVGARELCLAPSPRAMGTRHWASRQCLGHWALTSDSLQVRGKPHHDDQSLHIPDLHGADSALPRPHQVHIATSCSELRIRATSGDHCPPEDGNGFGVDANP